MPRYPRLISLIILSVLTSACIFRPYQPNIQQGNYITQTQLDKLRIGMPKSSVIAILGQPVAKNPYYNNQLIYPYTFWHNGKKTVKYHIIITLKNNRVSRIEKSLPN